MTDIEQKQTIQYYYILFLIVPHAAQYAACQNDHLVSYSVSVSQSNSLVDTELPQTASVLYFHSYNDQKH